MMLPSTNVIPGWCSIFTRRPVARLSMITASRSHGKGAIGVSSIQNLRAFNAEWQSGKQGLPEIESAPGGKGSPQIGRMGRIGCYSLNACWFSSPSRQNPRRSTHPAPRRSAHP